MPNEAVIAVEKGDGVAIADQTGFAKAKITITVGNARLAIRVTKRGHFAISLQDVTTGEGFGDFGGRPSGHIALRLDRAKVVAKAEHLMRQLNPKKTTVCALHRQLSKFCDYDDEIWPRWLFYADKHGVSLTRKVKERPS